MSILNSPIQINNLKIANRLVMPPMASAKSNADGRVSEKLCEYYAEKSAGGFIGLIITEHSFIALAGKASQGQLSIADDNDIEGLKKLTAVIHQNNTKVFAQINHAGGAAKQVITGCQVLSASAVKMPHRQNDDTIIKAMSQADINEVIKAFAASALRAKKAGFDGVELHSAHGYLLNQFYSPLTNQRRDRYNGFSIEGRIQFHLEIIQAVREAVGEDFPIALRLGACDYRTGGTTLEDSVIASRFFEQAGVDLLDISGGFCMYQNPESSQQGYFSELSAAIKEAVEIPVILTGGITEAKAAEALLQAHKADMIGVGRAILKDTSWPKRAIAYNN